MEPLPDLPAEFQHQSDSLTQTAPPRIATTGTHLQTMFGLRCNRAHYRALTAALEFCCATLAMLTGYLYFQSPARPPLELTSVATDRNRQNSKRPKWAAVIIAQRREIEEGVRTESDYGCVCRSRRL